MHSLHFRHQPYIRAQHSSAMPTQHSSKPQQHQGQQRRQQQQQLTPSSIPHHQEDELNFHDYIHSRHVDEKDTHDTRTSMTSPPGRIAATSQLVENKRISEESTSQPGVAMHSSSFNAISSADNIPQEQPAALSSAIDTPMVTSSMDHLYGSSPHHFPPNDLMPPPAQNLFRTLMEELQMQAAIQRDQFMASSSRTDDGADGDTADHSFDDHHTKSLPRFMTEPLDFLSTNYESCLESGPNSHAGTNASSINQLMYHEHLGLMNHDQVIESTQSRSSIDHADSSNNIGSEKQTLSDDSHILNSNDGTSTPTSSLPPNQDLSPPTQDLFKMLMEELETQAAIQRDQFQTSTTKPDITEMQSADFSFDQDHHQHQHHHRLPRFALDPFDFLSPNYNSMQMNTSTNQDVYMGSAEAHSQTEASANSASERPPQQENHTPPRQNLFRTLMEELETQAAFQRDQALAATAKTVTRVDPEEYVSNGQHLRSLPRFMFEPLDFLSGGYESYFGGELNGDISSVPHAQEPASNAAVDDVLPRSTGELSPSLGTKSNGKCARKNPTSGGGGRRKSTAGTKYKTILPHRPKLLTIAPRTDANSEKTVATLDSTMSPEPTGKPATGISKRAWTPKEEAQLLELFDKKLPVKDIARALDRTVHSVRSRRQILTDPGFVKGQGHAVSRRSCRQDSATSMKLPTYAQMAFLSLAWLPDLEGTLNDVAIVVEKLFSRHLNRIPRTGHKNLQIWRAQISDALAHEKGQSRPKFESSGVKRGRQWVYRLTEFGKCLVEAMGGVHQICDDLLKSNEMEMANALANGEADSLAQDGNSDRQGSGTGADAGIGQGQGYGYSYTTPEVRQRNKGDSPNRKRKSGSGIESGTQLNCEEGSKAIANALEAMAVGLARILPHEDVKPPRNSRRSGRR
ncbi:hypothetical protein BG011_001929 [Mortierella polycephala]|uniref:Myb-like domain-containing protein n=1 Tax=Mortierella polycephala TaxID=41804 RepID=A0A9P6Q667_9FUNG|nr:hypothetical protein BG011_001929 [Mortierella polycephala]